MRHRYFSYQVPIVSINPVQEMLLTATLHTYYIILMHGLTGCSVPIWCLVMHFCIHHSFKLHAAVNNCDFAKDSTCTSCHEKGNLHEKPSDLANSLNKVLCGLFPNTLHVRLKHNHLTWTYNYIG